MASSLLSGIEEGAFSGTLAHLQAQKTIPRTNRFSQLYAKNIRKITKIHFCVFDHVMIKVEIRCFMQVYENFYQISITNIISYD